MSAASQHADVYAGSPGREALQAGVAAFVHEENETAVTQLQAAIAADPALDEGHYMLGLAFLRLGRRGEAIQALEQAVATTGNAMLRDYASRKLAELSQA